MSVPTEPDAEWVGRLRAVVAEVAPGGEPTEPAAVRVESAGARELLRRLAEDEQLALTSLVDLTAVDRGPGPSPLEIVYLLESPDSGVRVRVTAAVPPGASSVPSLVDLHPVADWLEREVYDQFGIGFDGHPDLRRILRADDAPGHPLRKTHPRKPACGRPGAS